MEKISTLYIGEDYEIIRQFDQHEKIDLAHFSNGIRALRWLSNSVFMVFDPIKEIGIKNKVDVIVCETNLPGINGFRLYKMIKKCCDDFSIPFILVTSNFKYQIRSQAFQLGISDYFPKPLNSESLILRIQYLIEKQDQFKNAFIDTIAHEDYLHIKPYKTCLIKRVFDISVATTALLLASPIFLITAIALKLESKGPIFYASKRVGSNFKIFDFYKFRSMYPDADKRLKEVEHLNQYKEADIEIVCSECAKLPEGQTCSPVVYYDRERVCERMAIKRKQAKKAFLKIPNDPRITKVGNFIRNTSIDELPQLVNVLKGDMSIVGNRPLPVNEANAITKSQWARRFNAAAGLTGLWQVELRGKGGTMSEDERFKLDNQYAEKNSFLGDIKLILRTIPALFQKERV